MISRFHALLDRVVTPNVPSFTAFLCSLGPRKVDGTPRQAWSTLANEARAANLP